MLNPNKICRILVLLNVVFFGILFLQSSYSSENQSLRETKDFFAKDVESQTEVTPDSSSNRQDKQKSQGNYDNLSLEELKEINNQLKAEIASLVNRRTEVGQLLGENNPFRALGAYSREYGIEYGMIYFNQSNYGISHDEDYCEVVDLYNLNNKENIFEAQNFFTDHSNLSLVRNIVMKKLGDIFTKEIYKRMKAKTNAKKIYLDHRINNFFTNHPNFHWYHQIGRNFLCATQMYNHIPGHSALVNKGVILRYLNSYIEEYKDRPQCFNRESLFPISYRLFDKDECEEFFNVIQSEKYLKSLKAEPLQYLIKAAAGVHKAEGVYLLNQEMTESLNSEYNYGKDCGTEQNKQLIAQKYISNPLLLAHHNKFDFRIYMLIASTNPLIVYYHDGFPRVSLHAYNTSSDDKAAHLTNSALSRKVIQEAREKNTSINDEMTPNQIKKYRTWLVEDLVNYLLEIGKIRDKKWLDSYLRPAFKKALVHLVRMAKGAFWNASNVYELHGVDFMLDDKLKLWFIESNPNPYLNTETRNGFFPQMLFDLFKIQYAYYRSRMTRILKVVRRLQQAQDRNDEIEYGKWKKEYQAADKNRLEPEYRISKNNSFTLIVDENLAGHKAYFGHLERECV